LRTCKDLARNFEDDSFIFWRSVMHETRMFIAYAFATPSPK
jgi:hypothetical protein